MRWPQVLPAKLPIPVVYTQRSQTRSAMKPAHKSRFGFVNSDRKSQNAVSLLRIAATVSLWLVLGLH